MTKLSVNVNKVAWLRNARGGNNPDLVETSRLCELFGADGITVHPRPDERHIRRADVFALRPLVKGEFNMEGYPAEEFLRLVEAVRPEQVTLVPDSPEQLTSNHGWDAAAHTDFLAGITRRLKACGCRVSIFIDPDPAQAEAAAQAGADRVELYTEPYAETYNTDPEVAIRPFLQTARRVRELGMGLNAGHDLSLKNLAYLHTCIPWLDEVSIGHALIADALRMGLRETIRLYQACLGK
ncbi:MAG: pyridoxine 5'-phosphate synthase [Alloprevotella sp.]|nr:pyridoxine 5'-phosphate synthase [Alloprevotella sp.]MBR1653280.1 pyridoxine 5'-phosphate synthase [Alloprevotella sp.]